MAKTVNIVLVKLYPKDGKIELSRIVAAWATVARDIISNNLQGKAVVVTAVAGEKIKVLIVENLN